MAVRGALRLALEDAHAGHRLTDLGTVPMHALLTGLAPEVLRPAVPLMLNGFLELPDLHDSSLVTCVPSSRFIANGFQRDLRNLEKMVCDPGVLP